MPQSSVSSDKICGVTINRDGKKNIGHTRHDPLDISIFQTNLNEYESEQSPVYTIISPLQINFHGNRLLLLGMNGVNTFLCNGDGIMYGSTCEKSKLFI